MTDEVVFPSRSARRDQAAREPMSWPRNGVGASRLFLPQRGTMSLATGEGENARSIRRQSSLLLPHPSAASRREASPLGREIGGCHLPRWGKAWGGLPRTAAPTVKRKTRTIFKSSGFCSFSYFQPAGRYLAVFAIMSSTKCLTSVSVALPFTRGSVRKAS